MIPDCEKHVPFVRHRGPAYTVRFALLVGALLGTAGSLVGSSMDVGGMIISGGFAFFIGVTVVVGHLLAGVITPMAIHPFDPLWDDEYTLGVTKDANPIVNYARLAPGVIAQ